MQAFVDSVEKNNGYYIARYEASFGSGSVPTGNYGSWQEGNEAISSIMTDQKPMSQVSSGFSEDGMRFERGTLWTGITEADASIVSQNMYSDDFEATYVESDLINSYAWDTTIVFIQLMGNNNYSNEYAEDDVLTNTGKTGDMKCNIYDMSGNSDEWTTELSSCRDSVSEMFCTVRGGYSQDDEVFKTSARQPYSRLANYHGFRPILYLK